jgi:hypothetical protein
MSPDVKTTILRALEQSRGDDLARAKSAFRNKTPAQMAERWSGNGDTCAEVLAIYKKHEDAIDQAVAWIKTAD